jgi:acyl transferase domain-containing protein
VLNCKRRGAMLAVGLGATEVQQFLDHSSDVNIGCYNSPQSVTLSGSEDGIETIRLQLDEAGIFARKVQTSGNAYHSPLMKSASEEFRKLFQEVYHKMLTSPKRRSRSPQVPLYSAITGDVLGTGPIAFRHWQMNLESPTLFNQACQLLLKSETSVNVIVEIGPHSALAGPIRQITASRCLPPDRLTYLHSLVRGNDGVDDMLHLAGKLFTVGYPLDISRVNFGEVPQGKIRGKYEPAKLAVDLPFYQWNYGQVLWKDFRWAREQRFRKHPRHDLLGSRDPGSSSQNSILFRNHLRLTDVPWLRDHKVVSPCLWHCIADLTRSATTLFFRQQDT